MEFEKLIKKVNRHFNCDITENSRSREIVMARAAYYWIARHTTKSSLAKIGDSVGRDHASVLYSLKNFDDWLRFDEFFKADFEAFKNIILSGYQKNKMTAESMLYKYNSLLIENDILKNEIKKLKRI